MSVRQKKNWEKKMGILGEKNIFHTNRKPLRLEVSSNMAYSRKYNNAGGLYLASRRVQKSGEGA